MAHDTIQRRAIRAVFESTDGPLSPTEVLEAAQPSVPGLGLATVYRTLKMLTNRGWLTAVELPGDSKRYERSGKPHHHHFVCRVCEQAFDIDACSESLHGLVPDGFRVERHDLTLFGVCAECASGSTG
jgi:Fur family ferric uptake transcriptional regulator